jgi:aryl-alcohol dehydrogenase-like predicted oxidoreductase
MEFRPLGTTDIRVSAIALGCWPIAGMSSAGVNDRDSLATIEACFDVGINFIDTAYAYGMNGESERLIALALGRRRDQMVIATKGGIHWEQPRTQVLDARPETLRRECDESLRRLNTDRVELYYLHAPDPKTPIADSAGEMRRLMEEGKTRSVGISNVTLEQIKEFTAVCPIAAIQPPYNMLQREIEADVIPWCIENRVSVLVYWPLMKGLLAGHLRRDHVFPETDSRRNYPAFQGDEWQKNHELLDELDSIASRAGLSLVEVVLNWTIHRPGITSALCGAKRPGQIRENAGAAGWRLTPEQLARIDAALVRRGKPITRLPV